MKIELEEGKYYKYSELMGALEGGSQQFYLPFRGQQVFAAFLNKSKNPKAPKIILVGSRPRVAQAGALLARQQTPIPVFVKQATDRWCYEGRFRSSKIVEGQATDDMAKEAKREDVAFAVGLEKVVGDVAIETTFEEGQCGQVTRNIYERSDEARTICLQHHGWRCCVCSLLFEEEYGTKGVSFIHVHHLRPLYASGGGVQTDPVNDLRPVCPNCHAMIHAGGKLLTPEEVQKAYWSSDSLAARTKRSSKGPRAKA